MDIITTTGTSGIAAALATLGGNQATTGRLRAIDAARPWAPFGTSAVIGGQSVSAHAVHQPKARTIHTQNSARFILIAPSGD